MKIKFCCDNGANIHSKKTVVYDVKRDLLLDPEEWAAMSEDDQHKMVEEWAMEQFNYWWEPVE